MNTDTARMVYEVLSPMSVSEMSKELKKQTKHRLINTVLEESGLVVLSNTVLEESIETHKIVLCKKCLRDEHKNVRAAKSDWKQNVFNELCQACVLDNTVIARKQEFLR